MSKKVRIMSNKPRKRKTKKFPLIEEPPNAINDYKTIKYIKGSLLGSGGFADVHLCCQKGNHEVIRAIKIIDRNKVQKLSHRSKLKSEIKIHRSLSHKNICNFHKVFQDGENIYIVLEYCKYQSLMEVLKRLSRRDIGGFTEIEVKFLVHQILEGTKYLHDNLILHRDLKIGNLFLDKQMNIKIGDFGLAAKLVSADERKTTICGTPNYIAPEIISMSKLGHSYEVDVWCIGVILYTLLIGKPPFETNNVKLTYSNIKKAIYTFPKNARISNEAVDLINMILQKDPAKRPTITQILNHHWFTEETENYLAVPQTLRDALERKVYVVNTSKEKKKLDRVPFGNRVNVTNVKKNLEMNKKYVKAQPKVTAIKLIPSPSDRLLKITVKTFSDHTSKYGMTYLLSNGIVGCFFNDRTTMLVNKETGVCTYIYKKEEKRAYVTMKEIYDINDDSPKEKKKCALIKHFLVGFEKDWKIVVKSKEARSEVYVKNYLRNDNAYVFRFSNSTIQVIFKDESQLNLFENGNDILFVDKKGNKKNFGMKELLSSGDEVVLSRLKYTKKLLGKLVI